MNAGRRRTFIRAREERMYSRRDFGKTMLASVPAAVLYRATPEAAAIDRQTEAVLRLLQGRAEVLGRAADGGDRRG
jgi:hypothetical protein